MSDGEGHSTPCMWMRGGTSKGGYFLAADLPRDEAARDAFLLAVMGSPDPRQIDGMGVDGRSLSAEDVLATAGKMSDGAAKRAARGAKGGGAPWAVPVPAWDEDPKHASPFNHVRFYMPDLLRAAYGVKTLLMLDDDVIVQQDLAALWDGMTGNLYPFGETM